MKNKIKLGMCSALLIGSLVSGAPLVAEASSNDFNTKVAQQVVGQFKDVNKSNYAYDAINWAKGEGIIHGYEDGTFKPSGTVTEAQFVKMLAEFIKAKDDRGDLPKVTPSAHWSDTYYDALATYGVPVNGYFDNGLRNKPVKRGVIAQAIGHLTGNSNTLTSSIDYMLGEGITSGQNPQFAGKDLLKYFGSQNNLTRGQVAAFLYRMHNADIDEAVGISIGVKNNSEGLTLVGQANKGMSKLDNSLRLGKLGSEKPGNGNTGGNTKPNPPVDTKPDYSNSKIPVADGATRIDVDTVNKVVSKMSDASYKKIINAGYRVIITDTNFVRLGDSTIILNDSDRIGDLNIMLKDSDGIGSLSYNKSVSPDLIISLSKEILGINLTKNDLYPSYENSTSKYFIGNFGDSFILYTLYTK